MPPVIIILTGLGFWSSNLAARNIDRAASRHLQGVLDAFVDQELEKRNQYIIKNQLDQTSDLVQIYMREAVEAAFNYSFLRPGRIFAFDSDGRLIFDTSRGRPERTEADWKPVLREISNNPQGRYGRLGDEIYCLTVFEPWDWQLIAAVDDSVAHAEKVRVYLVALSVALGAAILITIILGLTFHRFAAGPVYILREAIERISAGLPAEELSVTSRDDIGCLARGIEKTAHEILYYRRRILQLTESLEQQIEERSAELGKSEESLAKAQELAHLGSWDWDIISGEIHWSDEVFRIFGLRPHEFSADFGKFLSCIHPDEVDRVQEAIDLAIHGEKPYDIEHLIVRPNGEQRVVREIGEVSFDDNDRPVRMVGTVQDITERKEMERAINEHAGNLARTNLELTKKNAELDEFTYAASHDLQEPLRKLIIFSGLLQKDLGGDLSEKARLDLYYIIDAAERMQTLVQSLLHLSRAGRAALKQTIISPQKCAQKALEALSIRLEETGAKIEWDNLPDISCDETLLIQLYQNLIGNGLKFIGPDSPVIRLSCEHQNGDIVLGVKDNGIGLKTEYAEQIFLPFKRLHLRSEYEGAGIGLAICRKIVEIHGGRIWVESEPGKGAHFRFTLKPAERSSLHEQN